MAELELLPVAERGQLLDYFIRQKQAALRPARLELTAAARQRLLTHSFPVNMREL